MSISPLASFFIALLVGFTPKQARKVVCVIQFESAFKVDAHNKSNKNGTEDHGLMQINDIWVDDLCKGLDMYRAMDNIRCGYLIYHNTRKNFNPWYGYKKNKHVCTYDFKIKDCTDEICGAKKD